MRDDHSREPGSAGRGSQGASVERAEEQLAVDAETREVGSVRVRKHVERDKVDEVIPRSVEAFDEIEARPPNEQDSGEVEVLPDGSVSIPVLEEELVITKRTVVRERVVVKKRTETRHERVEAEIRKERMEIEADAGIDLEEER